MPRHSNAAIPSGQVCPLFLLKNGTPLSRQGLVEKIKTALAQAGVDSSHYSGNSFRIGAATTAAACSVSDATIQLLGRWKSDCYTRYIRQPHQELATTARLLARLRLSTCHSCVSCHAFVRDCSSLFAVLKNKNSCLPWPGRYQEGECQG